MGEAAFAEIIAILKRISEQLEQLPRAIAAEQHRGASLTGADRHVLSIMLPAINAAIGSAPFTTRSLTEEAGTDEELQARLDLVLPTPINPRRIGKLLARADGFTIDGLIVKCEAKVKDGLLWRIARV